MTGFARMAIVEMVGGAVGEASGKVALGSRVSGWRSSGSSRRNRSVRNNTRRWRLCWGVGRTDRCKLRSDIGWPGDLVGTEEEAVMGLSDGAGVGVGVGVSVGLSVGVSVPLGIAVG